MPKTEYFGVKINAEIKKKFLEKINKNYYKGKIARTIEKLMEGFINAKD